ncbi:MAG: hypothetical protein SAJ12_11405 [Jaaginema sp. PMC 1079.18]|nr:hypothetical protein [Jaaginema sp. PMC 1080.18]MEC4851610.1 hypothetical protein [Jaaginema sp. PMC 1079.18]MEC4868049.1 hypothetical protein [Jaaginema sp. PMC 1078.18]
MSEADFSNPDPQMSPKPVAETLAASVTPEISPPNTKPIERFEQRITDETVTSPDASPADLAKGRPRLREADWFSLARKLRQRNRDLLQKVALLEQDLAATQEALQTEIARSRSVDTLNTQQSQEISLNQAKIRSLYADLEASHQATQQQESANTTLIDQLQTAQTRIAELQQEYTHLHHHYQQQNQQLQDIQTQSQELAIRLHRQQRQTLQFKAALDKCLAARQTAVPEAIPTVTLQPETPSRTPVAMKAQPIQPWSSQGDEALPWANTSEIPDFSPLAPDPSESDVVTPEATENSEIEENWREFSEEGAEIVVSAFDDIFDIEAETIEDSGISSEPPLAPEELLQEKTVNPPAAFKSPSPVVYPERTSKKRKSLAAIELPSFPRYKSV